MMPSSWFQYQQYHWAFAVVFDFIITIKKYWEICWKTLRGFLAIFFSERRRKFKLVKICEKFGNFTVKFIIVIVAVEFSQDSAIFQILLLFGYDDEFGLSWKSHTFHTLSCVWAIGTNNFNICSELFAFREENKKWKFSGAALLLRSRPTWLGLTIGW